VPDTLRLAVYPDADAAVRAAADLFTALAPGTVALAGGSTPRALYELLASADYRDRSDWHDLEVFFGDERAVPPDHPDSNFGMANRALLSHVPLAEGAVHRMEGEADPLEAAAERYAMGLPDHLDLVLLGMGPDGHTASLFPGQDSLDERNRRVMATTGADGSPRITLTYPAIEAARHVVFLVTGEAKREALDAIRRGEDLPAGRVRPTDGDAIWIVDRAAAGDDS
jgi:6-phosphogluconolactonase